MYKCKSDVYSVSKLFFLRNQVYEYSGITSMIYWIRDGRKIWMGYCDIKFIEDNFELYDYGLSIVDNMFNNLMSLEFIYDIDYYYNYYYYY